MLQSLRERLTLLLIALLPLHAFLVTIATKLLMGRGHAPLAYLAVWKEALLGAILLLSVVEAMTNENRKVENGKWKIFHFDVIDVLILALLILAIVVSTFNFQLSTFNFFLGFRYDFIPLVAFFIARRVAWSEAFMHMVSKVLIGIGVVVSAYGILTAFLPMKFFLWLGYSPAHSLYFADGPVAAFQQVSDTALRRIQSTMSGPNQFGLWLLLPLSVLLMKFSLRKTISYPSTSLRAGQLSAISLFVVIALFLTFSRAAWIAAFVMAMVTLCRSVPRRLLKRVAVGAVLIVVAIAVTASLLFPSVFFRLSSSRGHLTRPLQAIGRMWAHPLGEGLGSAGPASNRVSETCVFLRPQDDPSWAKTTPRLCVFLGQTQVQPADHVCRCPFLPENWYLQIGVELGVLGFVLFISLIVLVLRRLGMESGPSFAKASEGEKWKVEKDLYNLPLTSYLLPLFLAFLGISIAALFLHAWEDSAVAYTLWLLAATQLRLARSSS